MKHPALLALERSLARPTTTPCTWRSDREAYVSEKAAELRACTIEPIAVEVVASDWAQRYAGQPTARRKLVAIARDGDRWLLFDQEHETFALAYGANRTEGALSLLGFESDDALAEWLG